MVFQQDCQRFYHNGHDLTEYTTAKEPSHFVTFNPLS